MLSILCAGALFGQPVPLVEAAGKGDLATVSSLLADGANPDQTDNSAIKGWTALMAAAESGSSDVVRALIIAGVDCWHVC